MTYTNVEQFFELAACKDTLFARLLANCATRQQFIDTTVAMALEAELPLSFDEVYQWMKWMPSAESESLAAHHFVRRCAAIGGWIVPDSSEDYVLLEMARGQIARLGVYRT